MSLYMKKYLNNIVKKFSLKKLKGLKIGDFVLFCIVLWC